LSLLESLFYVGVDWPLRPTPCVLGSAGLLRRLGKLSTDPTDVQVERPDGRLVDALLEHGYPLVPVSPNPIKTWRDGEVLSGARSGARSEAGDAAVIAECLRLRTHRLRPATPFTAETKALRHCGAHPGRRRA